MEKREKKKDAPFFFLNWGIRRRLCFQPPRMRDTPLGYRQTLVKQWKDVCESLFHVGSEERKRNAREAFLQARPTPSTHRVLFPGRTSPLACPELKQNEGQVFSSSSTKEISAKQDENA